MEDIVVRVSVRNMSRVKGVRVRIAESTDLFNQKGTRGYRLFQRMGWGDARCADRTSPRSGYGGSMVMHLSRISLIRGIM